MADVIGFLREEATFGEKQTLALLKQNLPKEYSVYVETPIHKKRDFRYPDFVILTNYGYIILEVKDWVTITGTVTPHGANIRTRKGDVRFEQNPVAKAREFALAIASEIKQRQKSDTQAIPWGYAAVLYNFPSSTITQLRRPWGEEFVLGRDDLQNPDLLLSRLKLTFLAERMRPLTKEELSMVRAIIYPIVEIERVGKPSFVLDPQQEKIVAEPIYSEQLQVSTKTKKKDEAKRQGQLFESLCVDEAEEELPANAERLSKQVAIRLIRGFSGSGKTLVLVQRAKFLAAQYPDWKIGVFTYNKPLQEQLERDFEGTSIKPRTFHSLCYSLLHKSGEAYNVEDWLDGNKFDFPIIREIGKESTRKEFEWLQDMALIHREAYLQVERHGIGATLHLTRDQRSKVFDAFEDYRNNLTSNDRWEYHELPLAVLNCMDEAKISTDHYDAILIDEAQDWAPAWFQVINRLLDPDHGLLFLADDPSQSIYRYFSWKEKGVDVVGRSRWLRVPYRNTYEIYKAAYCMIADNSEIQTSLAEDGELVSPDLSSQEMRHGAKPLIRRFRNAADELSFIRERILALRQEGFHDNQVAVLARFREDLKPIQNALRGLNVIINPIHSFKGLETEVVFIPYLHKTFVKENEGGERRIMYMAMTRARSHLYLTYSGKLAKAYDALRTESVADFIEY